MSSNAAEEYALLLEKCKELEETKRIQQMQLNARPYAHNTRGRSIFVGQVDYQTTETELADLFQQCGTIERITIVCDKYTGLPRGKAYVAFVDPRSVLHAVERFHNAPFRGRFLQVAPKWETPLFGNKGGGGKGGGRVHGGWHESGEQFPHDKGGGKGGSKGRGGWHESGEQFPPDKGGGKGGSKGRGGWHELEGQFAPTKGGRKRGGKGHGGWHESGEQFPLEQRSQDPYHFFKGKGTGDRKGHGSRFREPPALQDPAFFPQEKGQVERNFGSDPFFRFDGDLHELSDGMGGAQNGMAWHPHPAEHGFAADRGASRSGAHSGDSFSTSMHADMFNDEQRGNKMQMNGNRILSSRGDNNYSTPSGPLSSDPFRERTIAPPNITPHITAASKQTYNNLFDNPFNAASLQTQQQSILNLPGSRKVPSQKAKIEVPKFKLKNAAAGKPQSIATPQKGQRNRLRTETIQKSKGTSAMASEGKAGKTKPPSLKSAIRNVSKPIKVTGVVAPAGPKITAEDTASGQVVRKRKNSAGKQLSQNNSKKQIAISSSKSPSVLPAKKMAQGSQNETQKGARSKDTKNAVALSAKTTQVINNASCSNKSDELTAAKAPTRIKSLEELKAEKQKRVASTRQGGTAVNAHRSSASSSTALPNSTRSSLKSSLANKSTNKIIPGAHNLATAHDKPKSFKELMAEKRRRDESNAYNEVVQAGGSAVSEQLVVNAVTASPKIEIEICTVAAQNVVAAHAEEDEDLKMFDDLFGDL
jgi:polyadenylate-binding protein 2